MTGIEWIDAVTWEQVGLFGVLTGAYLGTLWAAVFALRKSQ